MELEIKNMDGWVALLPEKVAAKCKNRKCVLDSCWKAKNTEKVSLLLFVLGITHSSLSAGSSLKYLHDFQISSFGGSHGPGSTTSEPFSLNKKPQSLTNTCTFASKQFFGG